MDTSRSHQGSTRRGEPTAPEDAPIEVGATRSSAMWDRGDAPALSVGIPTHEHPDFLGELVAGLEEQTYPRDRFEIVIVDDGSSEATWAAVERIVDGTPLRVRALRHSLNHGPAAARNTAASSSRAPVIVFIDDDCLPAPEWLAAYAEAFDGDADLVQGRTLGQRDDYLGPWARTVWVTGPSWLFETCNIGYRRASFVRLEGFDVTRPDVTGRSRPHFGEDAELGWRFRASGMRTTFSADALAYHRQLPGDYGDWLRELRRRSLFARLVRRTPGMGRALFLGVFLSKETAAFDLAVASGVTALATWIPWFAAGVLPWLWMRWRDAAERPGKPRIVRLAQLAVGDAVGLVSLVEGSFKGRRIVL